MSQTPQQRAANRYKLVGMRAEINRIELLLSDYESQALWRRNLLVGKPHLEPKFGPEAEAHEAAAGQIRPYLESLRKQLANGKTETPKKRRFTEPWIRVQDARIAEIGKNFLARVIGSEKDREE
jgi:hypothetical protein